MEREVSTVRRFYGALARRDWNTAAECFTEDAIWYLPGRGPLAGDHRGWNAIFANFLAKLEPLTKGTFRAELVDVLVGEQLVAAFQHATGERDGKRLDLTACQVMRFRDGRIANVYGHYSDLHQLDHFWS